MTTGDDQLALVRETVRRSRTRRTAPPPPAAVDPVARVAVDVPLPHLDRPFDYEVPEPMSAAAVPGARVRVRFAGRLVDGWVLDRAARTDHEGRLQRLARVVSPEPALTADVLALAWAVADRYAGSLVDVLRAAVPPRHARAERHRREPGAPPAPPGSPGPWADYAGGAALLERVTGEGPGPRAVWTTRPATDWTDAAAHLVHVVAAAGHGVLLVAPDARDVARVATAVRARTGDDAVAVLTADLGPERRYRAFLDVLRGDVRVVVGTRAAAFAPVADLRLVLVWDDGDDLLAEPHAPYWHAREVAVLRSHLTGCALVLAGRARTTEAEQLVSAGWARAVVPSRPALRASAPRVVATGSDVELARDAAAATARLPHLAWTAAREGLAGGPVLVQVPRRGYVPATACQRCRTAARCPACSGPLALSSGHAVPVCGWCGRVAGDWACPSCGSRRLRAVTVGSGRTAEELGRAFPGVAVLTSGGDRVLDRVAGDPAVVVATPGAEPVADGGYAAVLLLDARAQLERPGLRAGEEAVRRWFAAASLARPAAPVVVTADNALAAVQSLVRWDPGWFAARELAERAALGLPPAARVVALTGARDAVDDLLALVRPPSGTRRLGPAPHGDGAAGRVRCLLVAPRADGLALAAAVHAAAGVRSAKRSGDPVEVRVDPVDLG